MRVGVSQRAQDQQEKITEEEERDQEATSWWRRMNSGKKFRGSKGEKGGSVKQLSENQEWIFTKQNNFVTVGLLSQGM